MTSSIEHVALFADDLEASRDFFIISHLLAEVFLKPPYNIEYTPKGGGGIRGYPANALAV